MARASKPPAEQERPGKGAYQGTCLRINRTYARQRIEAADAFTQALVNADVALQEFLRAIPRPPGRVTEEDEIRYLRAKADCYTRYQAAYGWASSNYDAACIKARQTRDDELAAAKAAYDHARAQAAEARLGATTRTRGR